MQTIAKIYLASVLLVFWGFTVGFFGWPRQLGERLGIHLASTAAVADFRAMYGGMCLGVGILFWLGIRRPSWRVPAVLLSITTAAGLLLGRLITWGIDGDPGPIIYGFMGTEVAAIAVGVWLLKSPEAIK